LIVPRKLAAPQSNGFQARAATVPASFDCSQINGDPDAVCVHACGELDIATAPHLLLTLREAVCRAGLVVLDLGDLAFIDSAGVHAIVNASVHARQLNSRLVVLPGPASVERIFALAGAHGNFAFGIAEAPVPANADATGHEREQGHRRFPRIAQKTLSSAAASNAVTPLRAKG
jgi:anti-anti-sigma factor